MIQLDVLIYAILYEGLEHLWMLISLGEDLGEGADTNLLWIPKDNCGS